MVLPASTADDAPRESTFVDAIRRQLNRSAQGLLVLVDHACPERLRELVLGLLVDHPDLWVSADVEDIVRVPEGTVMVLEPQAKDADFLNLNRPVFARRRLKVVLWCDTETTKALATRAVDFFDWISHRHECPPGAALHGVLGLRAAAEANAPLIVWTGGDLDACFREAFPGEEFVRISATRPYPELVEAVKAAGERWIVWGEIADNRYRVDVILQVLVEANRSASVIVESRSPYGFMYFHGRSVSLSNACALLQNVAASKRGLLAALTGLEPESIPVLKEIVTSGRTWQEIEFAIRNADDPGAVLEQMTDRPPPHFSGPSTLRLWSNDDRTTSRRIFRTPNLENLRVMVWHAADAARDAAFAGQYREALALAKRANDLAVQVHGDFSHEHVEALTILANVFLRQGKLQESDAILRDAFAVSGKCDPSRPATSFLLFDEWTDVLSRLGRYEEAEEKALRAVEAAKATGHRRRIGDAESRLQKIRALRQRSS